MNDYRGLFEGKKITVMGLGLLGRAVGDAKFLAEQDAQVLVTDMKTEEQLAESVAQLKQYPHITFHLGGHIEEDFTHCDMVLKAAGVRLDSPYIAAARAAGVPVMMSTALFAKYAAEAGAIIVGITGTRGKSTVTQMIFHALQKSGKKALLGGNVRGVSTLAMLPDVQAGDIVVLELDSWQLQGFGDLQISPHIAVFTNLLADHQNYYKDMDEYFADKANIFKYQKEGDVLIIGHSIRARIEEVKPPAGFMAPDMIPLEWVLKIPGLHNRENASLTVATLRSLGLSESEIKDGLESFEGVEGRLQFVGEVKGVKIYNDNNATTPDATIAALRALSKFGFRKSKIVLIMGGADKGLDMTELIAEIDKLCKEVVFLRGSGTDALLSIINKLSTPCSAPFDSLKTALDEALRIAEPGDTILFSPAFASFGMFKNEYDRNDQFMHLVRTVQ